MSLSSAIAEAVEAVSSWLNPDKKEKRVLKKALEAAEQLILILRKQGRYALFPEKQLKDYEIHYQKQFDAWKDGTS